MPATSRIKVAIKGYRVIATAGIIGSGNIRLIITKETICPRDNIIAMYIKPAKCKLEKRLQMPQNESKSQSQPLMK